MTEYVYVYSPKQMYENGYYTATMVNGEAIKFTTRYEAVCDDRFYLNAAKRLQDKLRAKNEIPYDQWEALRADTSKPMLKAFVKAATWTYGLQEIQELYPDAKEVGRTTEVNNMTFVEGAIADREPDVILGNPVPEPLILGALEAA